MAGTGTYGDGGSGIPATSADLASPTAIAVDGSGLDLYIADTFNNMVREEELFDSDKVLSRLIDRVFTT